MAGRTDAGIYEIEKCDCHHGSDHEQDERIERHESRQSGLLTESPACKPVRHAADDDNALVPMIMFPASNQT